MNLEPCSSPAVISAPPPLAAVPPVLPRPSKPDGLRWALAFFLSLSLGLFLADALVSLLDDALVVLCRLHLLALVRALTTLASLLLALVLYALMALTPMIPKRYFLLLALFPLLTLLAVVPLSVFFYDRLETAALAISAAQVLLGVGILQRVQGGFRWRWPLVPPERLGARGFSWWNLSGFVLASVFVLVPACVAYLAFWAAVAINHFSDGFVALRPRGLTVQVREYTRDDGKKVRLIPMAHVGDAAFYQAVSDSFPTNSTVMLEGVTDSRNLLTNKITYERMAKSLGLSEQHEAFEPKHGELVWADVDVEEFSSNTIGFLNLVMLLHGRGVNVETLTKLMQYSPPPNAEKQLLHDLLQLRNDHLLEQIASGLSQSENIMVPWGAAHMPGLAREIQKSGFRLKEARDYTVIAFRFGSSKSGSTEVERK